MMGIENTGKIPFSHVYLHGLIRDERGEKMSKVKGNVLNPLETIDKYGTDALRMAVITGNTPGSDIRLTTQKLEAGRNFANKLWNAARYVMAAACEQSNELTSPASGELPVEDRWIISRLNRSIHDINHYMEDFQFGEAARRLQEFVRDEFCDWYIEISKIRLRQNGNRHRSPVPALISVLETSLRLLHPFMPFVTEEIWQKMKVMLPEEVIPSEALIIAHYPQVDEGKIDVAVEREMGTVIEIIRAIRNARAEFKVEASRWIEAEVYMPDESSISIHNQVISTLSRAEPLAIINYSGKPLPDGKSLILVLNNAEVRIPFKRMLDVAETITRLNKEAEGSRAEIDRLEGRLNDGTFIQKAPLEVVQKEREKLATLKDKLNRIQERLVQLQKIS